MFTLFNYKRYFTGLKYKTKSNYGVSSNCVIHQIANNNYQVIK